MYDSNDWGGQNEEAQTKRSALHRLLIRLSQEYDSLPPALFITNVTLSSMEPQSGGGFADIFKGTFSGDTVTTVAVKRFRLRQSSPQSEVEFRRMFNREALIWKHLKHEHVLPFLGIASDAFSSRHIAMVSPWMHHGHILEYLGRYRPVGVDVNKLLCQIAAGLQYLHGRRVVHGDLRGVNILIDMNLQPRVADFGLAKVANATRAVTSTNRHGSMRWMAPELLFPEKYEVPFERTYQSDVYAFGCVCLEVYTEKPPFSSIRAEPELILKMSTEEVVQQKPSPRDCQGREISPFLWNLMQHCWRVKAEERPTMDTILAEMKADQAQRVSYTNSELHRDLQPVISQSPGEYRTSCNLIPTLRDHTNGTGNDVIAEHEGIIHDGGSSSHPEAPRCGSLLGVEDESPATESETKWHHVRQKVLAIGRISRYLRLLQEESHQLAELKRLSKSDRLPLGVLGLGSDGISDVLVAAERQSLGVGGPLSPDSLTTILQDVGDALFADDRIHNREADRNVVQSEALLPIPELAEQGRTTPQSGGSTTLLETPFSQSTMSSVRYVPSGHTDTHEVYSGRRAIIFKKIRSVGRFLGSLASLRRSPHSTSTKPEIPVIALSSAGSSSLAFTGQVDVE
ncbi:hypothetical protein JAAARDRAFT_34422 [Jaapia argillacea MUCL 33604]|uniref:Protein kinase domain-containing protein n=1 Tax=Jaapia argillacea MUCL 33604 TaxID=933084 RepID=A0A067PUU7_9AGAM|nr:hypothetical protein JAAARDRAFT_34422 [Jaapia argillacea MUCL 33604]